MPETRATGVIVCVGARVVSELIQSLIPWGGRIVIYGGYSPERFQLHNFDILMKGVTIKPYAYRYFFTPPRKEDEAVLHEIAEEFGQPAVKVRVGAMHPLEDFKIAVGEMLTRPERGKCIFSMPSVHASQQNVNIDINVRRGDDE